jgi:hypothetical protein
VFTGRRYQGYVSRKGRVYDRNSGIKAPPGWWDDIQHCHDEAMFYATRGAFACGASAAYTKAKKNKWLDDMFKPHSGSKVDRSRWTLENCRAEALKYTTRTKFQIGSGSAYQTACVKGWLDEICSPHMGPSPMRVDRGHWTLENCRAEALKYKTRIEFNIGSGSAYQTACVKGWLDEICSPHMVPSPMRVDRGHWTLENCRAEALKYETRAAFKKNSGSAHEAARKNGWLHEICSSHMRPSHMKTRSPHWSLKNYRVDAQKFKISVRE